MACPRERRDVLRCDVGGGHEGGAGVVVSADETPYDAAKEAIAYVLRRVGNDVDFADIMLDTNGLALLTKAHDALLEREPGATAKDVERAADKNCERRGKPRRERDQERIERLECERDWYRSLASGEQRARCDEEMRERFSDEGAS